MGFSKQSVIDTVNNDLKLLGKVVPAKEISLRKVNADVLTTIDHWNRLPYDAASYTASNGSVYPLSKVEVFSGFAPFVLPASVTISGNPCREVDLLKHESIFEEGPVEVGEEKKSKSDKTEGAGENKKGTEYEGVILSPNGLMEATAALYSVLKVQLTDAHFRNLSDLRTNCALSDVRERLLDGDFVPVAFPYGSMPVVLKGDTEYYKDSGKTLTLDDVFNDWSDQLKKLFQ